jgi:hypothetical protein
MSQQVEHKGLFSSLFGSSKQTPFYLFIFIFSFVFSLILVSVPYLTSAVMVVAVAVSVLHEVLFSYRHTGFKIDDS